MADDKWSFQTIYLKALLDCFHIVHIHPPGGVYVPFRGYNLRFLRQLLTLTDGSWIGSVSILFTKFYEKKIFLN